MNKPSYKELWLDERKDRDEQLQWIRNAVNGEAEFCYSELPYSEEEELARQVMTMHTRIAELKGVIEILEDQQREVKNILIDKNLHIDSLYEEGYKLQQRIAELEAAQRWIPVSERLPIKSGWYLAGLIGWAGGYYTAEVNFDAETGLPWRNSVRDEVFCWLDGVPELPQPPEVQE